MNADHRERPTCTIIGGPNGSGKSTIYDRLALPGRLVNADVTARSLSPEWPEAAAFAAGRHTLTELGRVLATRESFVYETTLSSRQSIDLMRAAAAKGYEIGLVFVALNSVDLNIQRVAERVARGGHDIPEDVIRRRYKRVSDCLPKALQIAKRSMVFDNSFLLGPRLLLQIQGMEVEVNQLDASNDFHRGLAKMVGDALSISADAVLLSARCD